MPVALPEGLLLRAPTMDDAAAVTELANICILAERDTSPLTTEEVRFFWQTLGVNLATDAWAVVTSEGRLIAYTDVFQRGYVLFYSEGYVHPEYCGQSIGTYLLRLAEARAHQQKSAAPPNARVSMQAAFSKKNEAARQLVEMEGYNLVRHTWEMKIEMDTAPPVPDWPDGMSGRTFIPDQDIRPAYIAVEEAFQDHWNYMPTPFEEWEQRVKREDFDPTLWFFGLDGQEIAGAALCRYHSGMAWVGQLAVRRLWRERGLGMALLLQAFGEFYRRGQRQVSLTVDSQNTTGAVRLYERAGMRVDWQYDSYEKELRPGTA